MRISKESIFTGLNNLKIISITNMLCAEYFGFTSEEIEIMLRFYSREDQMGMLKEWYDGYIFGDTEVYNPWSVLNYVDQLYMKPTTLPIPYWSNTSSNTIIQELVKRADLKARAELELLIEGGAIEKPIKTFFFN